MAHYPAGRMSRVARSDYCDDLDKGSTVVGQIKQSLRCLLSAVDKPFEYGSPIKSERVILHTTVVRIDKTLTASRRESNPTQRRSMKQPDLNGSHEFSQIMQPEIGGFSQGPLYTSPCVIDREYSADVAGGALFVNPTNVLTRA
jgi:hypothetical protein